MPHCTDNPSPDSEVDSATVAGQLRAYFSAPNAEKCPDVSLSKFQDAIAAHQHFHPVYNPVSASQLTLSRLDYISSVYNPPFGTL